jgi:hippurate hydrolase
MLQALDAARSGAYQRLVGWHGELTAFRRDLHAHPELGYEEVRTAARVAEALRVCGVDEVHTGIGKTASWPSCAASPAESARMIGLRADMDALPIARENDFAWRSASRRADARLRPRRPYPMLVGAARYLAQTRRFDGTVALIFQPGEEGYAGAKA